MSSLSRFPVHPLVLACLIAVPIAIFFGSAPQSAFSRVTIGFLPLGGVGKYVVIEPTTANALSMVNVANNPINIEATLLTYDSINRKLFYVSVDSNTQKPSMVQFSPMTQTSEYTTPFSNPSIIFAMQYDVVSGNVLALGTGANVFQIGLYYWTATTSSQAGYWTRLADLGISDNVVVDAVSAFDSVNRNFYFIATAQNGLAFTLYSLNVDTRTVGSQMSLGSIFVSSMAYDTKANTLLAILPSVATQGWSSSRVAVIDTVLGTVSTIGSLPQRQSALLYTTSFDIADEVIVTATVSQPDGLATGAQLAEFIFNNARDSNNQLLPQYSTSGKAYGTVSGQAPFPDQSVLPYIYHPDKTQRMVNEDVMLSIQSMFRIESPDYQEAFNIQLYVQIVSKQNNWIWIDTNAMNGKSPVLPAPNLRTNIINLYGDWDYINSQIAYLYYQGQTYWNSETHGVDTVFFYLRDQSYDLPANLVQGSNVWTSASSYGQVIQTNTNDIWVKYVNNGPTINGILSTYEILTVYHIQTYSTLFVYDVDVNEPRPIPDVQQGLNVDFIMEYYITAGNGVITLVSSQGLTFLSGAIKAQTIKMRGQMIAINTAITGCTYVQNVAWNKPDTITMYVNDLGNSGQLYPSIQADFSTAITIKYQNQLVVKPNPTFSGDGAKLFIDFYQPTNRAGMGDKQQLCSAAPVMFDQATLATLGSQALCQWDTQARLTVSFIAPQSGTTGQTYATLLPQQTIHLLGTNEGGPISGATSGIVFNNYSDLPTTYPVLAPVPPIPPTAILSAPSIIDTCVGVTLDATSSTGSGGRLFSNYIWGVDPSSSDYSKLLPIINAANAQTSAAAKQTVVISADAMSSGGTYIFTLQVINFLNSASAVATRTIVKSSIGIPTISFFPTTQQIYTPDVNIVTALLSQSTCVSSTIPLPPMTFQYYSIGVAKSGFSTFTVDSTSSQTTQLKIPSFTLTPGFTYRLNVTATLTATLSTTNPVRIAQTVDMLVLYSPLIAIIGGGSKQVGLSDNLNIDAGQSVNPDSVSTTSDMFQYKWTCSQLSGDCPGYLQQAFGYDLTQTTPVPSWSKISGTFMSNAVFPGVFAVNVVYFISVEIRMANGNGAGGVNTGDNRVSSTKVTYTIVNNSPLKAAVTRNGDSQSSDVASSVGLSVSVSVSDSPFSLFSLLWSCVSTDGTSTLLVPPIYLASGTNQVTSTTDTTMVVVPGQSSYAISFFSDKLISGKTYTVQATVVGTVGSSSSTQQAVVSQQYYVRYGPSGGTFVVQTCSSATGTRVCTQCPSTGSCPVTAVTQEVVYSVAGSWTAQDSTRSTNLNFGYYIQTTQGSTVTVTSVNFAGTGGFSSAYFPKPATGATYKALVVITDNIGASTIVTQDLSISFTQPADLKVYCDSVTALIKELTQSGNTQSATSLYNSLLSSFSTKELKACSTSVTTTLLSVTGTFSTASTSQTSYNAGITMVLQAATGTTLGSSDVNSMISFLSRMSAGLVANTSKGTILPPSVLLLTVQTYSVISSPANAGTRRRLLQSSATSSSQSFYNIFIPLGATYLQSQVPETSPYTTSSEYLQAYWRLRIKNGLTDGLPVTVPGFGTGKSTSVTLPTIVLGYISPATGWTTPSIQAYVMANPYRSSISSNGIASQVVRYGLYNGQSSLLVRGLTEPNVVVYSVPVTTDVCAGVSGCTYSCQQWTTATTSQIESWTSVPCTTANTSPVDGIISCRCTQVADTAVFATTTTASSDSSLTAPVKAGIIIAAIFGGGLIIVGIAYIVYKRSQQPVGDDVVVESSAAVLPAAAFVAAAPAKGSTSMLNRALEAQPHAETEAASAPAAVAATTADETDGTDDKPDAEHGEDVPNESDVNEAVETFGDSLAKAADSINVAPTADDDVVEVEDTHPSADV